MTNNKHTPSAEQWDIIISPKHRLLALNLAEIWHYRDLILLFVKRDFVAKYKQTVLGPLWHVIQPALTTIMSFLLFNVVAEISTDGKNPILFQMSGIVIWMYFSGSLLSTSNTFIHNAKIFGKVYFPRIISPLSVLLSTLIQLGIQMALLIVTISVISAQKGTNFFGSQWYMVLPVVVIMAGLALGFGIIISSLTTKYRDLGVLVTFGVQLLMFASAVNYPLSKLEKIATKSPLAYSVVKWNPLTPLVDSFRNAMLGGPIWYSGLAYSAVFMLVVLLVGIVIFNRVEKTFMDTV
ncbi:MAG: ABC transporter permease [Bacteroidetes bacterium]|nr:MAG: ABC transporter permease [Bacteroidota bacterium]